jgi:hypothetical protein
MTCDDHYEDGTYEEFVDRVFASYEHPANTKRLGQVFFKKLHKERPEIASQIKNTMFDPSASEYIHAKISDRVRSLWYEETD